MKLYAILFASATLFTSSAAYACGGDKHDHDETDLVHKVTKLSTEIDADMQKMMMLTQPGEQHKLLNSMIGDWTYSIKMWHTPDAKPEESTGKNSNAWIMDGRFIEQNYEGMMKMGEQSIPFKGRGLLGYNNMKKHYESIWMDNMTTGIMKGHGQYDATTKTITEEGVYSCPMRGEENASYRSEFTMVDDNTQRFSMFTMDKASGKEFKSMEIVYSRVK